MVTLQGHDGAGNIAQHLWRLANSPAGGPEMFRGEAEEIISRQQALQDDFRAIAGYGEPLPEATQMMLAKVYGLSNVRVPPPPPILDQKEIDRVAHNLWVLAKMPPEGPESFRSEAERLIEARVQRDRRSRSP